MTKLAQRGQSAAASLLVPSIALLSLALALLAVAMLPASGLAAPLEGAAPQLTISPAPATLPTTTVGYQSQSQEFVVGNTGEAEAWIEKVTISGPDAGEFNLGGSSCSGTWLQPGQQCAVWISFMPGNIGARQAAIGFQLGGGAEPSFELAATGAAPHLSIQPGSHDFGLQRVHGETARASLEIENDGEAGTQVNSLNFVGGSSNGFWVGNSDCYGRWLAPGERCSVEVNFGPSEVGLYATQLQASSNGANFAADLSGEGGQPVVEASPNPVEFGPATVGSTSPVQAVAISNSGNVPTSFFIGIVAGGDSASFQLLDENCTAGPLMPAASCTAHVRFLPQDAGPKSAHLAFFGDNDGGAMVALNGEGVAPAVTLVPSSFDFGAEAAGAKSPAQAFAIRNEGEAPIDLDSVNLAGADLDQFGLAGDECSGATLAPGDECLIRARFAPDGAGAKTATLRVRGEHASFSAALTGTGTDAGLASEPGHPGWPGAHAGDLGAVPRPWRHRVKRLRFFSRGDDLVSARARSRRLGEVRASTIPR